MKKKMRKKDVNLTTLQLNAKKFVLGPLWHNNEKPRRVFRPYYLSR